MAADTRSAFQGDCAALRFTARISIFSSGAPGGENPQGGIVVNSPVRRNSDIVRDFGSCATARSSLRFVLNSGPLQSLPKDSWDPSVVLPCCYCSSDPWGESLTKSVNKATLDSLFISDLLDP
jgi:hypothetical protein